MFGFERLNVWTKAIEFADDVYVTTRRFPDEERFGLCSQMRRTVVSISSNIAEGSGRSTKRDFSRFVEIAYSALLEAVSQLFIAKRQDYLADTEF